MKIIRHLAAALAALALVLGVVIAADAGAPSRAPRQSGLEEPTSLYVYAVQPEGCTPGYISINHARGADWTVAGSPTAVTPPSTRIEFPGGFQDDIVATPLPGYSIPRNVQSEFFVTVYPIPLSCYRTPAPAPATPTPTATPQAETPTTPQPGTATPPSPTATPSTPTPPAPSAGVTPGAGGDQPVGCEAN